MTNAHQARRHGVNSLTIVGNVASEPHHHQTKAGRDVLNFQVAVDPPFYMRPETPPDWFKVVMFGPRAATLARMIHTGDKVLVRGRVRLNTFTSGPDNIPTSEIEVFVGQYDDLELL